ncbi:MAG: hypothetical protein ACJ72M_04005 [Propionibacteriaceae bacterium]
MYFTVPAGEVLHVHRTHGDLLAPPSPETVFDCGGEPEKHLSRRTGGVQESH